MATLSEHPAAPTSGLQEISALADDWAAMAVQNVLEPDLDNILQTHLERMYRQMQGVRRHSFGDSSPRSTGDAAGMQSPASATSPLYLGGGYLSRFSIAKLSKIWPL
jgi:hypothetical protein